MMERQKIFVLFVTAQWCDYCCVIERELYKLRILLHPREFEGDRIPIYSLMSDQSQDIIKELKISVNKIPTIFLVK